MKKINKVLLASAVLLSVFILITACKKKEDPIEPAFIVTATEVQLQQGGLGLQFFGKCTNDDVKMTKAVITTPFQESITFNLNGNYFVKNEAFAMQNANEAYIKQTGTWTFTFIGNRTADNSSFSASATVGISK